MIDCADCAANVCRTGQPDALPDDCPMRSDFPDCREDYGQSPWREMSYHAARVEAEGYGRWPRIREIAELSRRMGFRRIGLAHCPDMSLEARLMRDYLARRGFEAVLPPADNWDPEGQARRFAEKGTELNVLCGMCIGHDTIFIRSSSSPVTCLVVKDVKLRHNPAAALYTSESYSRTALYRDHRRDHESEEVRPDLDNAALDAAGRAVVQEGRRRWCRIEEVIELAHRLGAKRLGVVFCVGFRSEARVLRRVLDANGFTVSSACCKTGSIPKEELGILDSEKVRPGTNEMICNPIAQAELLNREKVHLALLLGQCVGHDSATMARLEAPAVCVVAKDRLLAHNTVAALYAFEHGSPD